MNLYLEKCLPYLRKPFSNIPHFHCHPYSWPSSTNTHPVVAKSGWAKAHWFFNFSLIFAYALFVLFRTAQIFLDPSESLAQKFYMLLALQFYATGAIFHVAVISSRNGLVPFLRRYISFLKNRKKVIHFKHEFQVRHSGKHRCFQFQQQGQTVKRDWRRTVKSGYASF